MDGLASGRSTGQRGEDFDGWPERTIASNVETEGAAEGQTRRIAGWRCERGAIERHAEAQ